MSHCAGLGLRDVSRVLAPDAPREPYRRRHSEEKRGLHWGQRKLLMGEIDFLTRFGHLAPLVVYAGAAPGKHVRMLASLFPAHRFVLVDPNTFVASLAAVDNVEIRRELFTDALAAEFAGVPHLFVSDVRSTPSDAGCWEDMVSQQRWYLAMKPLKAMLKFRLPYEDYGVPMLCEYLAGELVLQPWAPLTSTETRLIPSGTETVLYDCRKYEEQMFHFNTVVRPSDGVSVCFDCAAEAAILRAYSETVRPLPEDFADEVSRALSRFRTLSSGNVDPEARAKSIAAFLGLRTMSSTMVVQDLPSGRECAEFATMWAASVNSAK